MYEIEFRGKLSEEKFESLKKFLDGNSKNLGPDDKDVYFYIFPDKLLKIVNNISKKSAKISLKLNRIGEGAGFEEIEVDIAQNDFEKTQLLFSRLNLDAKIMKEGQRRINYIYKNCEIALKFSNTWSYHIEIEQMIEDAKNQQQAEKEIKLVANELGVNLMTEEELRAFVKEVENKL